ncbi:hypothetical protein HYPSUDRAFT_484387 [Hypholoma sublateritium FD-334 SS-4]|uniref:Uncharacterized protein n=1 Tax=Hypholoma sublateritium (strain FD-334 SS-4) TaxID=945553 RepID=A0A0D2KH18_HYPSF|nr:hypothetical protein HYPSUDRAFT_484387 [Hypholoma sublateritium FD-334 SS-4]
MSRTVQMYPIQRAVRCIKDSFRSRFQSGRTCRASQVYPPLSMPSINCGRPQLGSPPTRHTLRSHIRIIHPLSAFSYGDACPYGGRTNNCMLSDGRSRTTYICTYVHVIFASCSVAAFLVYFRVCVVAVTPVTKEKWSGCENVLCVHQDGVNG